MIIMYSDINYLYVKNHAVMKGIKKEDIYEILNQAVFYRRKKSELLPISNNSVPKVYFLIKGKIKVTERDSNGREIINYISKENDLVGGYPTIRFLSDEAATVISTEAIYFTINQSAVDILISSIPNFGLNLSVAYGKMLFDAQQKCKMLAFLEVKERVLIFFKKWAKQEGVREGNKIAINNYLTHNDIAAIVCTCRQTVTSILNDLKSEGIITYSRKEIIIEDVDKIELAA